MFNVTKYLRPPIYFTVNVKQNTILKEHQKHRIIICKLFSSLLCYSFILKIIYRCWLRWDDFINYFIYYWHKTFCCNYVHCSNYLFINIILSFCVTRQKKKNHYFWVNVNYSTYQYTCRVQILIRINYIFILTINSIFFFFFL